MSLILLLFTVGFFFSVWSRCFTTPMLLIVFCALTLSLSLSLSLSLITFFLFPFCPITHFSHFLLAFSLLTHFDAHNKHSLVNICMQVNTHSPVSQEASQMCS